MCGGGIEVDSYSIPDYQYDWDVLLSDYKFSRDTWFGKNGHGEAWEKMTVSLYKGSSRIAMSEQDPSYINVRGKLKFLNDANPNTKASLLLYILSKEEHPPIITAEDQLQILGVMKEIVYAQEELIEKEEK